MISVEEAKKIIHQQQADWGVQSIPLAQAMGEVLAEDVFADRDFPPFDRVTMDGIALSYDVFDSGIKAYKIQETQLAGMSNVKLIDDSHAIEIMTGAILSEGCDLMIRYEDLDFYEKEGERWVHINLESTTRWKNVHRQGSDQLKGELLIPKGVIITAAEVAILATVGCVEVLVNKKPRVAIVSTGDELVGVDEKPLPHQIRKSNVIAIEASLNQLKIPNQSYHLLDDKAELKKKLASILSDYDVVLMSGGVSKGKADHVPEVLDELGVQKLFHRVAQRPGKPFWFGTSADGVPVFAFPGNPISTFMCFRVYFIPWLVENIRMKIKIQEAKIKSDFSFKPQIGYFLQVRSEVHSDGSIETYLQAGNGSGDLANLAKSDAFLYLPAEQDTFNPREMYEYYSFEISN